jgi:hypothetical protein
MDTTTNTEQTEQTEGLAKAVRSFLTTEGKVWADLVKATVALARADAEASSRRRVFS